MMGKIAKWYFVIFQKWKFVKRRMLGDHSQIIVII